MSDKYYNDTEYYRILKELKDHALTFTINGRRVSEEEFYKEVEQILKEGEKHADTV